MRRSKPKRLPVVIAAVAVGVTVLLLFGWPLMLGGGGDEPATSRPAVMSEPRTTRADEPTMVVPEEEPVATRVIHNTWSKAAIDTSMGLKLHSTCKVCKYNKLYMDSRASVEGGAGTRKGIPFFCEDSFAKQEAERRQQDEATNFARFSFSPKPTNSLLGAVRLPQVVPLILCAIGQRFDGPGGQAYVVESLKQWRLFHPAATSTIYLILDATVLESSEAVKALVASEQAEGTIKVFDPKALWTSDWRAYFKVFYIQGYMHPGGDRTTGNKNFNQHVSERFFAIEAVMRLEKLTHVIHMENDIMVYDSLLPTVHAAIKCGHEMATTVIDKKGVIPSVLYVKNAEAMRHFNTYLNEFLSCGLDFGKSIQHGYANDMTYLKNYYQLYGSKYLGLLPSWLHEEGEVCTADALTATSMLGPGQPFPLFDVASFGQWYSFAVARNRSTPPEHIRNAMKGRFLDATPPPQLQWRAYGRPVDDNTQIAAEDKLVPWWKGRRLLSLHIHAKNLQRFRSLGNTHYARG